MPNIIVDEIWPPIPTRQFDFRASYDGDEPDDDGNMDAGWGKTQAEAIKDLTDNYPRNEK